MRTIFAYLSKTKYTIFPLSISSSSLFLSKEGEGGKAAVDFVSWNFFATYALYVFFVSLCNKLFQLIHISVNTKYISDDKSIFSQEQVKT